MLSLQPYCIGVFLFTPSLETYVEEYATQSQHKVLTSHLGFEQALSIAKKWEQEGVEVIISRRATGHLLHRAVSVPVLFLPHSNTQLLCYLQQHCTPSSRVMVTSYGRPSTSVPMLAKLCNFEVFEGVYTTREDLDTIVHDAKKVGATLVVGGLSTQKSAVKHGISYLELPSTREQVHEILENAQQVAHSNREKHILSNEVQSMMDGMDDILLLVDKTGEILKLNYAAQSFLGMGEQEMRRGKSIIPYLGEQYFQRLIEAPYQHVEDVCTIHNTHVLLRLCPVMGKSGMERLVLVLRKQKDVLRQSKKIITTNAHGFTARGVFSDIVHKSAHMQHAITQSNIYAKTNASVLICGETGVGKEMFAQSIHNQSSRHKAPFVSISCTELPEQLLESELFGYKEGAFTGSRKGGKEGYFTLAHSGTIFLDEVDSASPSVQAKLLRVLQEKEITPVGGVRKITVDVKIVAASGRDLWKLVQENTFRKDLFFRLNVLSLIIQPLRNRLEDIEVLAPHFIRFFSQKYAWTANHLGQSQIHALQQYDWPGNVRQLSNFIEKYVLHFPFMPNSFEHLLADLEQSSQLTNLLDAPTKPIISPLQPPAMLIPDKKELNSNKEYSGSLTPENIRWVLERTHNSKTEASRQLGISRSTLWRKMKQFDIQ